MSNREITSPLRGIPRRELLSWIWLIAATSAAAKATELTYTFVRTSRAAQQSTRFDAGTIADLPGLGGVPLSFPEGHFWLAQTQEGVAALDGVCTHLDCLLGWDGQAHEFLCPCHGSRFDETGRYLSGPAPRDMDRFAVEVVDGEGAAVATTDFVGGSTAAPVTPITADAAPDFHLVVDTGQASEGSPAT